MMNNRDNLISIIVPCYNEEHAIPYFYKAITEHSTLMKNEFGVDFEYLFINDGSVDNTLTVLKEYANKDNRVKYISFSRNFGKESAMYAGLKNASGNYIAIMDADLQDPPYLLTEMYKTIIESDYDCVATRRTTRIGEPPIRSFFARCFYKLINRISKTDIVDGARDYRLMTRQMVMPLLIWENIIDFQKEFSVGSDLIPNGLNTKMSKELLVKQNGLFGNYSYIPLTV